MSTGSTLAAKRSFNATGGAMQIDAEESPHAKRARQIAIARRSPMPVFRLDAAAAPPSAVGPVSVSAPPSPKQPQQRLYSLDEVKLIVAKAVQEHDAKLRAEYDRILQQKLHGALFFSPSFLSRAFFF